MPYISRQRRTDLHKIDHFEIASLIENPGELNYVLTRIARDYVATHGERYQTYNDVLGVLAAMQHEIYRRLVAPYEDKKIAENGDVF